jgi:predicted PurR-regulated permease PerM
MLLLGIVLVVILLFAIVLGGITSQSGAIRDRLDAATGKIGTTLKDAGVGDKTADDAKSKAKSSVSSAAGALLHGVATGLSALASLAAFAAFTALSLFFLLKDGPSLRDWVERHAGVPRPIAHTVVGEMLRALRGYFRGVTAVAAFNAVVIGIGALIIGVPLAGTIAIVTFIGAYIPYLGAWTAGAFAVLIALGAEGGSAALAMAVVALLANGALQQIIQPFAFGAALGIHPLAVLIVTIAGGALFGMIGLVLAAPVTSAIVHISRELSGARGSETADAVT